MKLAATFFAVVGCCIVTFAQKNDLRKNTLQEIACYIEHPFEFLGKTDSAIIAAGRPASIMGGSKWKAEVTVTGSKNSMNASKAIKIGTGSGALLIFVSNKTGLAYTMTFIAHKKSKVDGSDIQSSLKGKYTFNNGNNITQIKDEGYVGIGLLKGGILIVALEEDKQRIRFK